MWLEAKNLSLPYGSIKLAPRRHGPFRIEEVISPVVYWLRLPPQWTIHPIFHASLLTPYVQTKEHGENYSRPPPDHINDQEQYEVETIRSHRCHGKKKQLQYLIKWAGYPESDNTWEPVDYIQAPQLVKEYERHQKGRISMTQVQPIHQQSSWGTADVPNSAPSKRGLPSVTSILLRFFALIHTPPTSSLSPMNTPSLLPSPARTLTAPATVE